MYTNCSTILRIRRAAAAVSLLAAFSTSDQLAWHRASADDGAALRLTEPDKILDGYVRRKDGAFSWKIRRKGSSGKTSYSELILTSQRWRGMLWKHQLFVIVPPNVPRDCHQALLVIAGGSWKDELERPNEGEKLSGDAQRMLGLASVIGSPIAVLKQVPRQPLFGDKYEDAIISYTFAQFFRTKEPDWPLLLPMVKSAVRAMDAVQEVVRQEWHMQIDSFTVTGASKRGWTTWLTGAVDPRATAIAPMVIDVLNMRPHMKLQMSSWGAYSEQIHDYTEKGLQNLLETPQGAILRRIVDPYSYRGRYRQPKLILIGTNDRYWPIDALNLYWNDLRGPKYITYVPNQGHGLNDMARVVGSINALHQHASRGFELPKLEWQFEPQGGKVRLRVTSTKPVREMVVWSAESPKRDFRSVRWNRSAMRREGKEQTYVASVALPASGYKAFFGEAVFGDLKLPYFFSTNVKVLEEAPAGATP